MLKQDTFTKASAHDMYSSIYHYISMERQSYNQDYDISFKTLRPLTQWEAAEFMRQQRLTDAKLDNKETARRAIITASGRGVAVDEGQRETGSDLIWWSFGIIIPRKR